MQDEGLSPFLFSLYINDFENYLIEHALENVKLKELSLFLFLYADDTVLFAESKNALQNMLVKLCEYSNKWNVHVNLEKTKIVVFRNNFKLSAHDQWFYNGMM